MREMLPSRSSDVEDRWSSAHEWKSLVQVFAVSDVLHDVCYHVMCVTEVRQ